MTQDQVAPVTGSTSHLDTACSLEANVALKDFGDLWEVREGRIPTPRHHDLNRYLRHRCLRRDSRAGLVSTRRARPACQQCGHRGGNWAVQ